MGTVSGANLQLLSRQAKFYNEKFVPLLLSEKE